MASESILDDILREQKTAPTYAAALKRLAEQRKALNEILRACEAAIYLDGESYKEGQGGCKVTPQEYETLVKMDFPKLIRSLDF